MNNNIKKVGHLLGSTWGQRITLLVIVMLVMLVAEPKFFSTNNVLSILLAIALYGLIAAGMLFVVLIGGIDLAIGSEAALGGTVLTMWIMKNGMEPQSFFTGFVLAIAVAVIVGLLHGFFDAYLHMPSFVVTLATQYALYGFVQFITNLDYFYPMGTDNLYYKLGNAKIFNIPIPIVWFVIVAIIVAVVLKKTPFGRRIYAVGGNAQAAELVGINSRFHKMAAYVICSVTASFAGMILVSMNMVSSYKTAAGYEGPVMMAIVIGAVNIMGGEGKMGGVFFGALLVGIINNVLILTGINTDYKEFVQGIIIVLAVALNVYAARKSQGLIQPKKRKSLFAKKQSETTT